MRFFLIILSEALDKNNRTNVGSCISINIAVDDLTKSAYRIPTSGILFKIKLISRRRK